MLGMFDFQMAYYSCSVTYPFSRVGEGVCMAPDTDPLLSTLKIWTPKPQKNIQHLGLHPSQKN